MTWKEWLTVWGVSGVCTALVVGWVFLCESLMSPVMTGIAGLGLPLLIIVVGGGLVVTR